MKYCAPQWCVLLIHICSRIHKIFDCSQILLSGCYMQWSTPWKQQLTTVNPYSRFGYYIYIHICYVIMKHWTTLFLGDISTGIWNSRLGESRIWDQKWSWVPWDSDPRLTVLAPQQQTHNYNKHLVMGPRQLPDIKTGWPIDCQLTLTLTLSLPKTEMSQLLRLCKSFMPNLKFLNLGDVRQLTTSSFFIGILKQRGTSGSLHTLNIIGQLTKYWVPASQPTDTSVIHWLQFWPKQA
jgi:hypothetical protein